MAGPAVTRALPAQTAWSAGICAMDRWGNGNENKNLCFYVDKTTVNYEPMCIYISICIAMAPAGQHVGCLWDDMFQGGKEQTYKLKL
jgi:hypothetical protein